MESTAAASLLSIYSTSGLFNESQVDILSSIETDNPSDCGGDTLTWAGGAIIRERVTLYVGTDESLTAHDFEDWGNVLLVKPALVVVTLVELPFLTFSVLAGPDTFNQNSKPMNFVQEKHWNAYVHIHWDLGM